MDTDADVSSEDHVTAVEATLRDAGLKSLSINQPDTDEDGGENSRHREALGQLNTLWNGDSVLHTAAASGSSSLIPILMLYGATPTIKNHSGHTPYLVAQNKEVRDSFRRFMAEYPGVYDYEGAYIPSPLTEEMERERSRKEAEKRKEKKRARRQKEKVCKN